MKWNTKRQVRHFLPIRIIPGHVEWNDIDGPASSGLESVKRRDMSLLQLNPKVSVTNSATWPKTKKLQRTTENMIPRPQTATLEKPNILDVALISQIDMSLITKKGLLAFSNLCLTPIKSVGSKDRKKNAGKKDDGKQMDQINKYNVTNIQKNGTQTLKLVKSHRRKRSETGDDSSCEDLSSVSDIPRYKKVLKPKAILATSMAVKEQLRGTCDSNNNEKEDKSRNSDKEDKSRDTSMKPVVKKNGVRRVVDEVFAGPKPKLDVPEPCRTCGRPEQPERFHSHPAPSTARKPGGSHLVPDNKKTRIVVVKSSVRKPVPIKFRSGKKSTDPIKSSSPEPRKHLHVVPEVQSPNMAHKATALGRTKSPAAVEAPRTSPRRVVCYLCGREFTTASYPMHEPHCLQRWHRENFELPVHQRRKLPEKPTSPLSREEWNDFAWNATQGGLVPCGFCGRTFLPDRVQVHERSCLSRKSSNGSHFESRQSSEDSAGDVRLGSGRGPPTVYCYLCGRMFGTKSIAIHEPQCLVKWRLENDQLPPHQRRAEPVRPDTAPNVKPNAAPPCAPPKSATTPAPRPQVAARGAGGMKRTVPCYLCGQQFFKRSIKIHEPQCLKKWRLENAKLPPKLRRSEPQEPSFVYTESGDLDLEATSALMWQSHLQQLVPCGLCGRTFNPERLAVHERSCKGPKPPKN